jgi:hypothetical protein
MPNTAIELDQKAQQCAQNYLSAEASLLTVLIKMRAQNAFNGSKCATEFLCPWGS